MTRSNIYRMIGCSKSQYRKRRFKARDFSHNGLRSASSKGPLKKGTTGNHRGSHCQGKFKFTQFENMCSHSIFLALRPLASRTPPGAKCPVNWTHPRRQPKRFGRCRARRFQPRVLSTKKPTSMRLSEFKFQFSNAAFWEVNFPFPAKYPTRSAIRYYSNSSRTKRRSSARMKSRRLGFRPRVPRLGEPASGTATDGIGPFRFEIPSTDHAAFVHLLSLARSGKRGIQKGGHKPAQFRAAPLRAQVENPAKNLKKGDTPYSFVCRG